jgi:hypothetical protein
VDASMSSLETIILDILETKQPRNVKELVKLVQEKTDATLEDIKKTVKNLDQKGLVELREPISHTIQFSNFLFSKNSYWFWITTGTSILSFITIMFIPETEIPLSYIRYLFAFVLVAFLPGYCLTETLFPEEKSLDIIERFTFSIALSFAVTALVGLFLSFTSINLTLATALPALGSLVMVLAITALIRKFKTG